MIGRLKYVISIIFEVLRFIVMVVVAAICSFIYALIGWETDLILYIVWDKACLYKVLKNIVEKI